MKKLFLLSLITLSLAFFGQCNSAMAQKVFRLNDTPNKVDVSNLLKVEIIPSDKNEIHIIGDDETLATFIYKEAGNSLILSRKSPKLFRKKIETIKVKLYVRNPEKINEFDVSGASGVSYVLPQKADNFSVDLSGASKIYLEGLIRNLNIDVSGASKLETKGNYDTIDLDISGASKIILVGDFNDMEADISGASSVTVDGSGRRGDIEVSGASKFNGRKCYLDEASLEASGASSLTVNAKNVRNQIVHSASNIRVL